MTAAQYRAIELSNLRMDGYVFERVAIIEIGEHKYRFAGRSDNDWNANVDCICGMVDELDKHEAFTWDDCLELAHWLGIGMTFVHIRREQ